MAGWSRRRVALVVTGAAILVLVVLLLVVLPLIVRRVAVAQLTRLTGRAVALADVELNVFTGRIALNRFRLAQADPAEAALDVERLEVRVAPTSLVTGNVRVKELTVTRPTVHLARLAPDRYDFSDLLVRLATPESNAPPPKRKPSTTTITLERVRVIGGAVIARDLVPAPAAIWRLEGLDVDGTGLSTRRGLRPGGLSVQARLNGTRLGLDASAVELAAGRVAARVTVDGFDLAPVRAYLPPDVAAAPVGGRVTLDVNLTAERPSDQPPVVTLAGEARVDDLAVVQLAQPEAFLKIGRVVVKIKEARPLARDVTLAAVEIDGLDLRAHRDAGGRIDLLGLTAQPAATPPARSVTAPTPTATPPPAAATAPAPATAPGAPALRLALERLALRRARAVFVDDAVRPTTTLALTDIGATLEHLTWPAATPVALDVTLGLPTAGRLQAKGTATLAPFSADITMSLRDGSIAPYQPYIPLKAGLAGSFNGDSRSRVALTDGKLTATSQGRSWIENLQVLPPGGGTPPLRIARMEMAGIDFGWPTHAQVATITITKPEGEVERDASGVITLRELLTVNDSPSAAPAPASAAPVPASPPSPTPPAKKRVSDDPRGGAVGFPLDIGAIIIEDGYVRFLDRTVQPAFSETLSHFAVKVEGLSTTPGKRARLTSQAIVGGDAALEVHGELAPLGELFADITGELRDFALAQANPYADSFIAWTVERGKLGIKFHYHVERDQLDATNEVVVDNLHVAPARKEDEVQKRIGLPLGMIVALVTDADNGIRITLPMSGPLGSWRAGLSDAIWTVVRNAVVNVVAAPFRAIGRLFTGGGNKIESLAVDPVTFTPGSDVVSPEMARHLTAVGDFMRRAPGVRLTLAAAAGGSDLDSLRGQELTARLQKLQRERSLPDFAAAVDVDFRERFPDVALPAPNEQLARLREREPVPPERVAELLTRRAEIVREALTKNEGVPDARLGLDEAPPTTAAEGEGRVEFRIGR